MAENPFKQFNNKKVSLGQGDGNMLRLFQSVQKLRDEVKTLKPKRGVAGKDGKDGKNGKDGNNGKDGVTKTVTKTIVEHRNDVGAVIGIDGIDGVDGLDGDKGKDGRGVKSFEIEDGHLYVTFTDGTESDLGQVVGRDGFNGTNGKGGGSARSVKNNGEATDNALLKFDGSTGLASQQTGIIIDDDDIVSGIGGIVLTKVYNSSITVEEDYTASDKRTILVDASGGNRTVTLPTLTDNAGLTYNIMKIDSSSNTVTIKGDTVDDKINGEVCQVITQRYTSVSPEVNDLETIWFVI